jgi:hypothetical protein
MALTEFQKATFRHHIHSSEQIVDPETGDVAEGIALVEDPGTEWEANTEYAAGARIKSLMNDGTNLIQDAVWEAGADMTSGPNIDWGLYAPDLQFTDGDGYWTLIGFVGEIPISMFQKSLETPTYLGLPLQGALAGTVVPGKALIADSSGVLVGMKHRVVLAAASQSLQVSSSGTKYVGVADAVFTLPSLQSSYKGVWFEFECGAVSAGTGLSISPQSADNIRGNGLTAVNNKDLINSGATDRLGDMVRLYTDGDNWIIEAIIGTWDKQA